MNRSLFWSLITALCIGIQAFYSMMEMASVSFNRVRLQYYVSKKVKRAVWLQHLLLRPSRLFITVMLGVNVAMFIGSQSARELYLSLGLNPDYAALTQILFVMVFAELAPLFAARHFSEHVVMLGMPVLYATQKLFAPVVWLIGVLTQGINRLLGKKTDEYELFLSREELQKVLESEDEEDEFNVVVANIFSLRTKTAAQVMTPLSQIEMIPANATIQEMRKKLSESAQPFIPLYHKSKFNIIAIAIPRDLVRLGDNRYVRDQSRPPWFITAPTRLIPILSQFRRNRQSVAVVLDTNGLAIGILTLEEILEEIFGEHMGERIEEIAKSSFFIHRTFPGNTKIEDFNKEYGVNLPTYGVETLAQLMMILLDHPPKPEDSVVLEDFELIVEETTLLGIKSITVKSVEYL